MRFPLPNGGDEITVVDADPAHKVIHHVIHTPRGQLTYKTEADLKTTWITEYLIKRHEDVELIEKYMPVASLDKKAIAREYDELGDDGIMRGWVWGDQAGCWQHACCLMDVQDLIMETFDNPDWVHQLMRALLDKNCVSSTNRCEGPGSTSSKPAAAPAAIPSSRRICIASSVCPMTGKCTTRSTTRV
jgi:hypothetical protein